MFIKFADKFWSQIWERGQPLLWHISKNMQLRQETNKKSGDLAFALKKLTFWSRNSSYQM